MRGRCSASTTALMRGRRRFPRPRPPLPQARRDEPIALTAEPKIDGSVLLAALREGPAGPGAHPRRRPDRRGRHRQCPHHRRHPAEIAGAPDMFEVRGEIYMAKDDFTRSTPGCSPRPRRTGKEARQFANPRNAAAGIAAPEGRRGHRVAAAALPRLGLGRSHGRAFGRRSMQVPSRAIRRWGFPGLRPADPRRTISMRRSRNTARSRSSAPTCPSISTASSTRSTGSTGSSGSALSAARRAGASRTNSPPSAPRPRCARSTSRSAAPASSPPSPG
jgi:hypothetical protein